MEDDISDLITPEKINAFERSKASRDAVILLGQLIEGKPMTLTQARYVLVRDYIITQLMIDNALYFGLCSGG